MASKPTLLKWEEEKVSRELPIGAGAGETAHANPDSLDTPTIPQSGSKVNYLHLNTVQEKDRTAGEYLWWAPSISPILAD